MTDTAQVSTNVFICAAGCCGGCHYCYGMGLGCHQIPCRCDRDCTCNIADEDTDRYCPRHFMGFDERPDEPSPGWASGRRCPVCDPKAEYIADKNCTYCQGYGAIQRAKADYITRCLETTKTKHFYYQNACQYTAAAYIWPKRGKKEWKPVCGIHLKVYKRADNILEIG